MPTSRTKSAWSRSCARIPAAFVTASHDVSREQREYERTSTVAANAYVGPRVSRYLERLERRLAGDGFAGNLLIMQSSGGLCDVGDRARAVHSDARIGAGRRRGRRAKTVADALGIGDLICFDMGGTTAKACVLQDGDRRRCRPTTSSAATTKVWSIRIPVLDIKEVGTGGGSIAWIDDAGGLHVGPGKRRREPGAGVLRPRRHAADRHRRASACSGGSRAGRFLGGRMALDVGGGDARDARARRDAAGLDVAAAAGGILAIANAAMANAVRAVTTERGLDPRDFALVAYGGAGPLHAVDIARELAIRDVVDSGRARALLGLRHAGCRSAPRIRAHAIARRSTRGARAASRRSSRDAGSTRPRRGWRRPACRARTIAVRTRRRRALRRPGSRGDDSARRRGDDAKRCATRSRRRSMRAHLQRFSHNAPEEAGRDRRAARIDRRAR